MKVSWLFEIITPEGVTTERMSTKDITFGGETYSAEILPESFKGIDMQWSMNNNSLISPASVNFIVDNTSATYMRSDFVDNYCLISLIIDDVLTRKWKFKIERAVPSYGKMQIFCVDLLQDIFFGDFPTTKHPREQWPSEIHEPEDGEHDDYRIPEVFGTAYIPLMYVYYDEDPEDDIIGKGYYVLGPGTGYTVHEVMAPAEKDGLVWKSSDYSFVITEIDGHSLVEFMIVPADGEDEDELDEDDNPVFNPETTYDSGIWSSDLKPLVKYSRTGYTSTNPADYLENVLIKMGADSSDLDTVGGTSTWTSADAKYVTQGIEFNKGFYSKTNRESILNSALTQCHSTIYISDKIELHPFSKTSRETFDKSKVKKLSFRPSHRSKKKCDSGHVKWVVEDSPQHRLEGKELVSINNEGTIDFPDEETLSLDLIQDSVVAQKIGRLYFEQKNNVIETVSFETSASRMTSIETLKPGDVITLDDAIFGGEKLVIINSIGIGKDLTVSISGSTYDYLNEFHDLTFDPIIVPRPITNPSFGADVEDGPAGIDGITVSLETETQAFIYDSDGLNPVPATEIFSATAFGTQEGTTYTYQYFLNDVEAPTDGLGSYTYTPQVNHTDMPDKIEVQVIRVGDLESTIVARDQMSVYGLKQIEDSYEFHLDNPIMVVNTYNDGTGGLFGDAHVTSSLNIYKNNLIDNTGWTFSFIEQASVFTADIDQLIPSITINSMDDDTDRVTITVEATHATHGTLSNDIFLTKVKHGETPQGVVHAYCFLRAATQPATPTGGSYEDPIAIDWSDGPYWAEFDLWVTERIFTSNGETPHEAVWSTPYNATTVTDLLKYEFSADKITWWAGGSQNTPYMRECTRAVVTDPWTNGDAIKVKGEIGAPAVSPTAYWLDSPGLIRKDKDNTYYPSNFTFSAYSKEGTGEATPFLGGFLIQEYYNDAYQAKYTSSSPESEVIYTPTEGEDVGLVRCLLKDPVTLATLDATIINIVQDGDSAITAMLSNSTHTVPSDDLGEVTSYAGSGTEIAVYEGVTPADYEGVSNPKFTINATAVYPIGAITVGAASGEETDTCTIADHSGMDTEEDTISITFYLLVTRANGLTNSVTITQTITKSKAGAPGTPSKSIHLSASSQIFYVKTTGVTNPAAIDLTHDLQNITEAVTYTSDPVVTLTDITNGKQLTATNMGENDLVKVTATAEGLSDTMTIVRLHAGSEGYTVFLTNESHTYPSDPDGVIEGDLSVGSCEVRLYKGNSIFICNSALETSPTVNGEYRVTDKTVTFGTMTVSAETTGGMFPDYKITPSTFTTDQAVVTLAIEAYWDEEITTFEKQITYSKSKSGIAGQGKIRGICFLRSSSAPTTPTGGSFEDPTATGWHDGIPSGTDPVYMTSRLFTSNGEGQDAAWSTPEKTGELGQGTKVQFSIDGATAWHDTPAVDDEYMRTGISADGGATWVYDGAVKIKGETGPTGPTGPIGARGGGIFTFEESTSTYISATDVTNWTAGTSLTNTEAARNVAEQVMAESSDGYVRANDRVTVTDNSAQKAATRIYTGTAKNSYTSVAYTDWSSKVVETFNGSVIVNGTLSAEKLTTELIYAGEIRDSSSNMIIDFSTAKITINSADGLEIASESGITLLDGSSISLETNYGNWEIKPYHLDGNTGSFLRINPSTAGTHYFNIGAQTHISDKLTCISDGTSDSVKNIKISASGPTGGSDGDVWMRY